jgi:hypothetical protein
MGLRVGAAFFGLAKGGVAGVERADLEDGAEEDVWEDLEVAMGRAFLQWK